MREVGRADDHAVKGVPERLVEREIGLLDPVARGHFLEPGLVLFAQRDFAELIIEDGFEDTRSRVRSFMNDSLP